MLGSLLDRFNAKVRVTPTCWEWIGAKIPRGYGSIGTRAGAKLAHRVSHELNIGPIPVGSMVLHRCDNRACVNPAHLFLGDNTANMRDMLLKGRGNKARGERVNLAKLSCEDVLAIRQDHRPARQIAKTYRVHPSTIERVLRNETWKHL